MPRAIDPTPTPPVPAPIPSVEDDPRYQAARAAVYRLKGEVGRIERELSAQQQLAEEIRQGEQDVARRLVRGDTLAQVRSRPNDGVISRLSIDVRHARQGAELAERELAQVERAVAGELAEAFAPQFRARVRPAVLALVAFARAMDDYRLLVEELRASQLLTGPCANVLPSFGLDDPTSADGRLSYILRELLDAGVLDEKADARLLGGLAVQPAAPPYVPPAVAAPRTVTEAGASYLQTLRRLGVSFGSNW